MFSRHPECGTSAVPAGRICSPLAGSLETRPAGPMPVCEELAALVPERVLPFASGDSRKRGTEAEPKARRLLETAVERREARRVLNPGPGGARRRVSQAR